MAADASAKFVSGNFGNEISGYFSKVLTCLEFEKNMCSIFKQTKNDESVHFKFMYIVSRILAWPVENPKHFVGEFV